VSVSVVRQCWWCRFQMV